MGFWDTFVKTWQVRTSIRIQQSFEDSYRIAKAEAEARENIYEIIDELDKKNQSWEEKINQHRKQNPS